MRKLLCRVIFLSYKRCYLCISAVCSLDGLTLVTPRKVVLLSGVWPGVHSHEGFDPLSFLAGRAHWCRLGGGVGKRIRTQDTTLPVVSVAEPVAPERSELRC